MSTSPPDPDPNSMSSTTGCLAVVPSAVTPTLPLTFMRHFLIQSPPGTGASWLKSRWTASRLSGPSSMLTARLPAVRCKAVSCVVAVAGRAYVDAPLPRSGCPWVSRPRGATA